MITCNSSNLANMDKSTPTNYRLIFPIIPTETTISANNPFIMNIFSAILPSVSMATEELRWQGNKTRHGMEPMEFDPWLVSFVVDSRLENWKLLFKWMSYINNNKDKIAEEHHKYGVDAALVVTDNYNNIVLEIRFVDIWPSQIGEVSFSQREGDVTLESTVNFNYDYFELRETGWSGQPIFGYSSSSSSSSISSSSSSSYSASVPIRLTEDGDVRITEGEDIRIIE
jgi:hypothetical protein